LRAARRALLLGALVYTLFVIYGCLVPFHFTPASWAQAWARFEHIPQLQPGPAFRSDWIANVLLFIPLAFLWRGSLGPAAGPLRAGAKNAGVWAASVALVTALEFAQVYFPPRSVALQDVIAASVGAAIGLIAWRVSARRLLHHMAGWSMVRGGEGVAGWLLWPYAAFLVLYNVMPLDLTSSPYVVYEKWQRQMLHVVPFSSIGGGIADAAYSISVEAFLWMPLAALWALSRRGGRLAAWCVTVLLSIAVETVQILVQSRISDSTDVLCAAAGGLAGSWLGSRLRTRSPGADAAEAPAEGARGTLLALVGYFAWAAVLFGGFWYPYRFSYDPATIRARIGALEAVPFQTYWLGEEYHAFIELLRKLILFAPLGGLLALAWARVRGPLARRACAIGSVAAVGVVAVLVEAGQVFLPGKTPDSTDALIGTIGGAAGYAAALVVWRRLRGAASTAAAAPPAATPRRGAGSPTAGRAPGVVRGGAQGVVHGGAAAAVSVAVLWLGCWLALRTPAVPYNVRELFLKGPAIATTLGFAVVLLAALAPPVWLARWLSGGGWGRTAAYPALLVAHALLVWAGLRAIVPLEAIHDIVGTPVLRWPGEWEVAGRFLALFAGVSTLLGGGAILARALCGVEARGAPGSALRWLAGGLPLLAVSHFVVVIGAATDNLIELMAGGGGPGASFWIGAWLAGLGAGATALALLPTAGARKGTALLLAAASAPFGWMALSMGTAPVIEKYGSVFSAMQFLLSPGRDRYVSGTDLLVGYAIAHACALVALALAQAPVWIAGRRAGGPSS
jgi:VanZ family protein